MKSLLSMPLFKKSIILLICALLLGCDHIELESQKSLIHQVKALPVMPVDPFIKKSPATLITTQEFSIVIKDPFKLDLMNQDLTWHKTESSRSSSSHRVEAIKMVGYVEKGGIKSALLLLPSGKLMHVSQGDKLQAYQYEVKDIFTNGIDLVQNDLNALGKRSEPVVSLKLAVRGQNGV